MESEVKEFVWNGKGNLQVGSRLIAPGEEFKASASELAGAKEGARKKIVEVEQERAQHAHGQKQQHQKNHSKGQR
jgi:hypothetical protein